MMLLSQLIIVVFCIPGVPDFINDKLGSVFFKRLRPNVVSKKNQIESKLKLTVS